MGEHFVVDAACCHPLLPHCCSCQSSKGLPGAPPMVFSIAAGQIFKRHMEGKSAWGRNSLAYVEGWLLPHTLLSSWIRRN
jgi:hypothetical protein